jgi:hypothetical protein
MGSPNTALWPGLLLKVCAILITMERRKGKWKDCMVVAVTY